MNCSEEAGRPVCGGARYKLPADSRTHNDENVKRPRPIAC